MNRIFQAIKLFLRERFSLVADKDNEFEIVEAIRKSVPFKGINLWMLIFAVLIASVGLNVNSTAVVIGAMLISPLMGPIMGLGLGAGINDIELIRNGFKNLVIAVVFSVLTSALYFYLTPLNEAQSELLSRTSPTFWDVLIALFGGLAGVFAGSSKEKGNAIPGVAIATALMPPLCTAGYGLANLNMNYFFGAMYLFFINSVMISASTYVVVQFLNFRQVEYANLKRQRFVKRFILGVIILTIIPSIYFGYNIITEVGFKEKANKFIQTEFTGDNTYVVNKRIEYHPRKTNEITVYVGGDYIDTSKIKDIQERIDNYELGEVELFIKQGTQLKEVLLSEQNERNKLIAQNAQVVSIKDSAIIKLEQKIVDNTKAFYQTDEVMEELEVFYSGIEEFSISEAEIYYDADSNAYTKKLVYIDFKRKPYSKDQTKIREWLINRLDYDSIKLVVE